MLAAVSFATTTSFSRADEAGPSRPATPQARAQAAFIAAQKQYEADRTNNLAAGQFARVAFERAEFSTNDTERAALAVQGIAACRNLIARDPKSAPGHYYLGLNLGQMARTKLLGALRIVDEMEREFKTARVLDEQLDHAGPDRCLGLLYYEAPAIGSVGSRSKARKHLERAAELAPEFPPNRLGLAEAYLKWREKNLLKRELTALEKLWPAARNSFPDADWPAWSRRWQKLKAGALELQER
jgi:tetratricopeptide (TPR) repeat protein